MNSDLHKNPWFRTLVGITLWACGYITADDNRIEREKQGGYSIRTEASVNRDRRCQLYGWQVVAESRHTR